MSAISKAIDEIKFRIPRPILETVFIKRALAWRQTPLSIDEHILNEVVRPRVLVDCNLCGGTEVFIPLDGMPVERGNDYTSVYRIPKNRTQGRSILSVLNITFSDPTKVSSYGVAAGSQNSTMMQAGQAVMDAMGSIPVTSTAYVQLIGENVVMVRDTVVLPANIYLRCVLMNDAEMSHLQLRSYRQFSKLVELAVKAYIYNEYIIQMDLGELHAGQNLGRFKEVIDGYADSEELYQTFIIEHWEKIQFMNDRETYTRFIRELTGGYR
jgi:hypothetical protein